jgi:hypothetical protein
MAYLLLTETTLGKEEVRIESCQRQLANLPEIVLSSAPAKRAASPEYVR